MLYNYIFSIVKEIQGTKKIRWQNAYTNHLIFKNLVMQNECATKQQSCDIMNSIFWDRVYKPVFTQWRLVVEFIDLKLKEIIKNN